MGQFLSRFLVGVLVLAPVTLGAAMPATAADVDGE